MLVPQHGQVRRGDRGVHLRLLIIIIYHYLYQYCYYYLLLFLLLFINIIGDRGVHLRALRHWNCGSTQPAKIENLNLS